MSSNYSRKYNDRYTSLSSKNLSSILLRKFITQYGYVNKTGIARFIVNDILQTISQHEPPKSKLKQGQFVYYAVKLSSRPGYRKNMWRTKLIPIILTLFTEEEKKMLSEKNCWKKVRQLRAVRLANEAKEQGGVLSVTDLSLIMSLHCSTISERITDYESKNDELVPTRCVVHETGSKISHKCIAIERALNGDLSPDIAKKINHSTIAVDNYLDSFRRVFLLAGRYKIDMIVRITKMSRPLVRKYLDIIREYCPHQYIVEFDSPKGEHQGRKSL
jgi:hypothetical protein